MSIRRSWVDGASDPQTDFPLENLPFGVFAHTELEQPAAIGVAIGDEILDLRSCLDRGLLDTLPPALLDACNDTSLNRLMALGREASSRIRAKVAELLGVETGTSDSRGRTRSCLVPMKKTVMQMPVHIGDYTDFYASIHHATNVGRLFRPDRPLPPNYTHVPLAYHGRASSIVVSGQPIPRPWGQSMPAGASVPAFGPSTALDYEMEVGFLIGQGNRLGTVIPVAEAESAIFGLCLVNDWSARDFQAWESQPLGPFLSKSFATTISPWIVAMDALDPFRSPSVRRSIGEGPPLAYLSSPGNDERGGLDVTLEVSLTSAGMRQQGLAPMRLGRSHVRDQYWTAAQLVAHHASNGCNLRAGDLLGSGTVSGAAPDAHGCLLELTRRGAESVLLPSGERRTFLEDGDEVVVRAFCERPGHARIGFGECRGTIVASAP